jgi:adenylate cyclase
MPAHSRDPDFQTRARSAVVWQDLVTPVRTIVGYQEIILEEARRRDLTSVLSYLDKVLAAAGVLDDLVTRLHNPGSKRADDTAEETDGRLAKLRHDLRTPLNAIIGYSEMVAEDLEASPAGEALGPDLAKLLGEARQLLGRIDALVELSRSDRAGDDAGAERAAADTVIADLLKSLDPPHRTAAESHETGRILVVDDNESNRELLCRRLVLEGHQATVAASGREALEILEAQRFDLILLDLLMPDMNGIEVLDRLKTDQHLRDTPVIMISGLSETDAVIRCIAAGAEDYLPKPCDLVLLRARINASLERNRWRDREKDYLASLKVEKERSEALLRNILPDPIVLRLNAGEGLIADRYDEASILFADIVDFTPLAATMSPARIVDRLNSLFSEFDAAAAALGVEKIKTIGDAYMAATGLPEPRDDHAELILAFASSVLAAVDRINAQESAPPLQVRIGIHSGPVVAGVIGQHKFIYDVWGDTVNVASRLESQGVPGRIQVSEPVRAALFPRYSFEPRGSIALKGRGNLPAYLLVSDGNMA